jgi:hypothetical protein
MTSPAYAHGFDGLGQHLGMSTKAARSLDARVGFPRCVLPGVVRDVVLFRLSEVDEAIDRSRREKSQVADPVTRPAGNRFFDAKAAASELLS